MKRLCAALFATTLVSSTALANEAMTFQIIDGRVIAVGAFQPDTHETFAMFLVSQGKLNEQWNVPLYITSGGGALDAAMRMGRMIRERGMSVVAHQVCASACTYMSFGGVHRVVTKGTQFGVHQLSFASTEANPLALRYSDQFLIEFQQFIADIQDYTHEMGVDTRVISIASRTPPAQVTWLTRDQLVGLRIDNTPSTDPEGQPLEALAIPGVVGEYQTTGLELEELYNHYEGGSQTKTLIGLAESISIGMARRVITAEAQTEAEMEKSLLNSYALNVDFEGRSWTPEQILSEKRRMIREWGVRRRALEDDTVEVSCTEGAGVCTVTGIFNSELGLSEDGFISKARWNFTVDVIQPMTSPRVARESMSEVQ